MRVMIKFIIQAAIFAFFSSVVHADSHSEEKTETEQKIVTSKKLENSEERMNKVIALQEKREVLKKLNIAWAAYKNNEYQVAVDQWQELATEGNNVARFFLGLMHSQGQGFDQDDVEAANWYMLAADEGYIPAQWRLAISTLPWLWSTSRLQKSFGLVHYSSSKRRSLRTKNDWDDV